MRSANSCNLLPVFYRLFFALRRIPKSSYPPGRTVSSTGGTVSRHFYLKSPFFTVRFIAAILCQSRISLSLFVLVPLLNVVILRRRAIERKWTWLEANSRSRSRSRRETGPRLSIPNFNYRSVCFVSRFRTDGLAFTPNDDISIQEDLTGI